MKVWVFVEGFFCKIMQNIIYKIVHKMESASVGSTRILLISYPATTCKVVFNSESQVRPQLFFSCSSNNIV